MAESSTSAGTSAHEQTQTRTSARNKVKSQRAMDSEDTLRLIANVRARQKADAEAIARGEQPSPVAAEGAKSRSRKTKGKGKWKVSKEELYCVCRKPSEDDEGPMIECAECNDWFHFSCIDLSEEEAELIHDYICRDCQEATGQKTTTTYKSPSPIAGEATVSKRKQTAKTRNSGIKPGPSSATNSDDDGEADDSKETGSTSSGSGSDAEQEILQRKPIKRQRSSREYSRKPSVDIKPSTSRPIPASRKSSIVLPKARVFVLEKLAELVKSIFGDKLDDEGVSRYAKNLEDSLFEAFKDGIGPKAVAGGRYKTQFTLLDRSLLKARPELLAEITSFQIDATKVALLTSADLASAERLEELERAKRAALEQTVKQKEDQGTIRLGRDGFEKVEDHREREMGLLARQEQAARTEAERRESYAETPESPSAEIAAASPFVGRRESASATPQLEKAQSGSLPQSPVVKRESVDIRPPAPATKSPIKSNFGLTSAWSGGADDSVAQSLSLEDQSTLDLSDLVAEEVGLNEDMDIEGEPEKKVDVSDEPVVWSGGIVNPAVETSRPVRMEARVAAKSSFVPQWNILLPHDPIAITGRVPVKASLAYLSESRLNPSRALVTALFTPASSLSEDDLKAWNELIDFHIAKDRHAIYHPYGNRAIPPHGVKELYLIPLRPTDRLPEFTDLLDGFSVSSTRTSSIFLGVFIGDKKTLHVAPPTIPTLSSSSIPTPPQPAPPTLPNAKLQELMASLNPAALQGLSGSKSPIVPIPPQQPYQAYPAQTTYGQTQYPGQSYYPGGNGYVYNQYSQQGYPGHSPHTQQYTPNQNQGGNTPDWQNMPPPQNRDRDRQQGWEQRRNGDRRY